MYVYIFLIVFLSVIAIGVAFYLISRYNRSVRQLGKVINAAAEGNHHHRRFSQQRYSRIYR
jgi:hypothetical protein